MSLLSFSSGHFAWRAAKFRPTDAFCFVTFFLRAENKDYSKPFRRDASLTHPDFLFHVTVGTCHSGQLMVDRPTDRPLRVKRGSKCSQCHSFLLSFQGGFFGKKTMQIWNWGGTVDDGI